MNKIYIAISVSFFMSCTSISAYAADDIVFLCKTKGGKQLSITRDKSTYKYSFGLPGKPELVFSNAKQMVFKQSPKWNGMGGYIWIGALMKNGQYEYHVTSSVSRGSDDKSLSGEVSVSRNNKHIATLNCINEPYVDWDEALDY